MPGSSNFLQWNPNSTNQEADADYAVDAMRVNGAANPSIFPSETANKLFYQVTTFIAAFTQALANKGLVLSDASLSTLASTLASVVTQSDLVPYAPLASPAFTGTPTAPTPSAGNNSTDIATTAFIQNAITAGSGYNALFNNQTLNGALTVDGLSNLGGGAITNTPPTNDSSSKIPNTFWVQELASGNYESLSDMATSFANSPGFWFKVKGAMVQYGVVTVGTTQPGTFAFPAAFPNNVWVVVGNDQGSPSGGSSGVHTVSCQPILGNLSFFKAFALDYNGAPQTTNIAYIAIGN